MSRAHNPYGDGHACQRILAALKVISEIMSFETISVIGLIILVYQTAAFASRKNKWLVSMLTNMPLILLTRSKIHIVEPDWRS